MTAPKTTRKTGKTAPKPEPEKAPEAESREKQIIIDLAQRIEQRGRERFSVKSENIRKQLMIIMQNGWPHSSDQTLINMAILILTNGKPGDDEIFAEIRETNSDLIKSERPIVPYPGER